MQPPFFQAAIVKSPQSNFYRHKTTLRAPARESVSANFRNKEVCISQ